MMNVSFYENSISDESKYLEKELGPKYLSLTLVVPVTLTYVIIFVTGFIGNVITCIVIWRNPTMQTPTNYYLFNLAVSDLLLLILGAVVITFFICWAPFHIQRLLYVYADSTYDDQWVYPVTGCLYYFSTTINPILYNVMSVKYRNAFKETYRCSLSNPSISRVDLSSVRHSSTIYGVKPGRGSQVFRGGSINSQQHATYSATGAMEINLHDAAQLQSESEDGETKKRINNDSLTADKNAEEIIASQFLQQTKKSSVLVHMKNGRLRYRMSDKDDIPSSETHI